MRYRVNPFIKAHGASPGPRLRPQLTGFLSGILGAVFVISLSVYLGYQAYLFDKYGLAALGVFEHIYFGVAGLIYGKIYRRAALDRSGSWLFGLSTGFILWMIGPATIFRWLNPDLTLIGKPGLFVLSAHMFWGLIVGLSFPYIHMLVRYEQENGASKRT